MKGAWLRWGGPVVGAVAAGLAAMHVANTADAAHDAAVARALGLEAQPWGALDAALAGLVGWLPLGTLAARGALAQALALGAAGWILYEVARRLLASCADVPRLGAVVAAVGTWCAVLGAPWQLEGVAAGGAVLGALLVVAPLATLEATAADGSRRWGLAVFLVAVATGQDPLAGAVALTACAARVAIDADTRASWRQAWAREWRVIAACGVTGLLPLVLSLARARLAGASLADVIWAWPGAERGVSTTGAPWPLLQRELGLVLLAVVIAGAVLALLVGRARPLAAGVTVLAVLGAATGWAGEPLGPGRFGPPVLASLGAMGVLAAVSMQALVRVIAEARLPLARASATMVLILELVAPVDAADDALQRAGARARGGGVLPEAPVPAWDDAAWGALPPRAIVLVTDARTWRRAAAARAIGALRGDITVVPTFARGRLAAPFLARDAALVPLWRDLALSGAPSEESLSALAAMRPVAVSFDPAWGKALGKHFIPAGLFDRFEPEPRGVSDRRKLLEAFVPKRERLARAVVRDPDLQAAAAGLLRQRVLVLASSGDRDLVGGAVADLDAFAPGDPTGAEVVAHIVGRPR